MSFFFLAMLWPFESIYRKVDATQPAALPQHTKTLDESKREIIHKIHFYNILLLKYGTCSVLLMFFVRSFVCFLFLFCCFCHTRLLWQLIYDQLLLENNMLSQLVTASTLYFD